MKRGFIGITGCLLAITVHAQTGSPPGSAAPAAREPASLGRLFLTPEKRATLERQRRLNLRQAEQMEGGTLALEGIVRRGNGRSTVWINGRPYDSAAPAPGVSIGVASDASGATVVVADETPAKLRVGESINRSTRERQSPTGHANIRKSGTAR